MRRIAFTPPASFRSSKASLPNVIARTISSFFYEQGCPLLSWLLFFSRHTALSPFPVPDRERECVSESGTNQHVNQVEKDPC